MILYARQKRFLFENFDLNHLESPFLNWLKLGCTRKCRFNLTTTTNYPKSCFIRLKVIKSFPYFSNRLYNMITTRVQEQSLHNVVSTDKCVQEWNYWNLFWYNNNCALCDVCKHYNQTLICIEVIIIIIGWTKETIVDYRQMTYTFNRIQIITELNYNYCCVKWRRHSNTWRERNSARHNTIRINELVLDGVLQNKDFRNFFKS